MNTLTFDPAASPSSSAPSTAAALPAPFRIAAGAVLTLQHGRERCVHVIEGRLWITARGETQDHVVGPGGRHRLHGARDVVLEALGPSAAWVRIGPA